MANNIGRRQFVSVLGGMSLAWPVVARTQQPTMPVIGFLNAGSPGARAHLLKAFQQGLNEAGYVEGQNVAIEYRWADEQVDRLPALAADLVRRQVSMIVTPGSSTAPSAACGVAKAATATIPIIFGLAGDPVKNGLVASLNRPGGNATGVYYLSTSLAEKRLGLLRKLAPTAAVVAVLMNPNDPDALSTTKEVQAAADTLGQKTEFVYAANIDEIDTVFATIAKNRANAFLLMPDPLFFGQRVKIVTLANRLGIPAIFTSREYAETGGVMSYGTDLADVYRRVGGYAGRVLKGVKPADLPVELSAKFESS
jgi:putative tryptophan/tyrosine transport system substrate-binding protein